MLALLPEAGVVLYEQARAFAALGRGKEALAAYAEAIARYPGQAYPTRPLQKALDEALKVGGRDPALLTLAIEHEIRAGRLAQAKALLAQAEGAGDPGNKRLDELKRYLSQAHGSGVYLDR